MSKTKLEEMTLREKIGQTAIPAPPVIRNGVKSYGGYVGYLKQYPYGGLHCQNAVNESGTEITDSREFAAISRRINQNTKIPALITCDAEHGAGMLFKDLHLIPSLMAVGAASDVEFAYKRSYYWARELSSAGIHCAFGPVCDLLGNLLSPTGTRCLTDDSSLSERLMPAVVRGIQDGGIAATAKHFPGTGKDFRDSHFSMCKDTTTRKEWEHNQKRAFAAAINAGARCIMTAHSPFPAVDPSITRGKTLRPASASKILIDLLRQEMGFDGVIITDAVNMKSLSSAFEHDDIYVECFNAGNDMILFCHDDYIDVMEKAVADGRISMARLDASVQRILKLKEDLGFFKTDGVGMPLSAAEIKDFEQCNYGLAAKAMTLVNNEGNMIPFSREKIKNVTIIGLAPHDPFFDDLDAMKKAFESRDIQVSVLNTLDSKETLKDISKKNDMIIYACYLAQQKPFGFPGYSRRQEINTLFNGLSYGASKSVVASFGAPAVYYNYFETADTFINAYSTNKETMEAFVAALFGEIPFIGKSPVELIP